MAKEKTDPKDAPDEIEVSTGVVLRVKAVPPLILMDAMSQLQRPEPPEEFMENLGRVMTNPNHPDYIERVKQWEQENNQKMIDHLIVFGTEVVSIPSKFPKLTSKEWVDTLEMLGHEVKPDNKMWRYLKWMNMYVLIEADDMTAVLTGVGRLSGVAEDDVEAAERFHRSNQED